MLKRWKGNSRGVGTLVKKRRDGSQGVTKKSRQVQTMQACYAYRMAKGQFRRREEKSGGTFSPLSPLFSEINLLFSKCSSVLWL